MGRTGPKKTFSPAAYSLTDVELPCYAGNAQYDLATAQWGEGWYTPTKEQWDELIEHCDWEYVMINGINGVLFTSHKTYNTIFLPSTGYTDDETYKLKHTTYNLAYWTSTGWSNNGAHSYIANYEHGYMTITNRYIAHCVRAVCGVSSEVVEAREVTTEIVQTAEEATTVEAETAQTQESNQKKQDNNKKKQEKKPSAEKTARTVKNVVKTINTLNRIFR